MSSEENIDSNVQERKFSEENWRIFKELREEKRKLQEFDPGSEVVKVKSEIAFEKENENEPPQEIPMPFSPSVYTDKPLEYSPLTKNGHEIDIHKYVADSPIAPPNKQSPQEDDWFSDTIGAVQEKLETLLNSPARNRQRRLSSYIIQLHHNYPGETNNKPPSLEIPLSPDGAADKNDQCHIPASFCSLLASLFNVQKLKKFVSATFLKMEMEDQKKIREIYPTISFFTDAYDYLINENNQAARHFRNRFQSADLSNSICQEPPYLLLVSMLEIFHEELLQAKNEKFHINICMDGCRFTSKPSHTIVSHLFRGHLKKKIYCVCGYSNILDETFTNISIPLDEIEEKLIIINVVSEKDGRYVSCTRQCITVSNWTTVGSMKEKLHFVKMIEASQEAITLCFVDADGKPQLPSDGVKIFDLISVEGQIWLFDASMADLSLNLTPATPFLAQSTPRFPQHDDQDEPSQHEATSSSIVNTSITTNNTIRIQKKTRNNYARVFVYVFAKSTCQPFLLVLNIPRLCHGLHVYERFSRMFNLNHQDYPNLKITIKNKVGRCLFCMESSCGGCPIQMCDKIITSDLFTITVHVPVDKVYSTEEGRSVVQNSPINLLTLDECLRAFFYRKEQRVCPKCLQSCWKPSETIIIKCPDVFTIHLPSCSERTVLYKHKRLRPYFCKKSSNREYTLSSIVLNDSDCTTFVKQQGEGSSLNSEEERWVLSNGEQAVTSLPTAGIELLFYIRTSESLSKKSMIQTKIIRRLNSRKEHMLSSNKISGRSVGGSVKRQPKKEREGSTMDGCYTSMQSTSDLKSVCSCQQCECLKHMKQQIVESRHSLEALGSRIESRNSIVSLEKRCNRCSKDSISCQSENSRNGLERKLLQSVRSQNLKEMMTALKQGANVNYIYKGMAALHLSAGMAPPFGELFVQLCLDNKADVCLPSQDGMTPLHIATAARRAETVKMLLKAGALPQLTDNEGRSCFDLLLHNSTSGGGSEQILRLLRGEHHDDVIKNDDVNNHDVSHVTTLDDDNERTFNEAFLNTTKFSPIVDSPPQEPNTSACKNTSLKESIVSDQFTNVGSDVTFNGSRSITWFLCSSRLARRKRRREMRKSRDQGKSPTKLRRRLSSLWASLRRKKT